MRRLLALVPLLLPATAPALTGAVIDVEAGPLYVARNEGDYGAEGTFFDEGDVGQQDTLFLATRVSAELGLGERHTLVLLYAPLALETRVRLREELRFDGTTFAAGTVVDHRYRFDGYRASYLYRLLGGGRFRLEGGGSLQIRSAEVAFSGASGTPYAERPDIGFVPALKVRATWDPGPAYLTLDADGLSSFGAGDAGGALYDAALWLGVPVADPLDLVFRVRLYGGGADVGSQDLYNWAHFVSGTVGLRVDLAGLFSGAGAE